MSKRFSDFLGVEIATYLVNHDSTVNNANLFQNRLIFPVKPITLLKKT